MSEEKTSNACPVKCTEGTICTGVSPDFGFLIFKVCFLI